MSDNNPFDPQTSDGLLRNIARASRRPTNQPVRFVRLIETIKDKGSQPSD